jgi:hypothetical protein
MLYRLPPKLNPVRSSDRLHSASCTDTAASFPAASNRYFPHEMNILRCPSEILAIIFSLACTDGGATGAALRLVCRRFSDLAGPFRFRTIHVSGQAGMLSLLKSLECATSSELVNIQHLFICDRERDKAYLIEEDSRQTLLDGFEPSRWRSAGSNRDLHAYVGTRLAQQRVNQLEGETTESFIVEILALCAPNLRTLTYMIFNPLLHACLRNLAEYKLPYLTHLSVLYPEGAATYLNEDSEVQLSMPRLRSLSINIAHEHIWNGQALLMHLLPLCPLLQDISIDGICETPDLKDNLCSLGTGLNQSNTAPSTRQHLHVTIIPPKLPAEWTLQTYTNLPEGVHVIHTRQQPSVFDVSTEQYQLRLYDSWSTAWFSFVRG